MTPVVRLLEAGLLAWFGALALLVIIRVLRDGMATGGMLVSNPDKDSVDPERWSRWRSFPPSSPSNHPRHEHRVS